MENRAMYGIDIVDWGTRGNEISNFHETLDKK